MISVAYTTISLFFYKNMTLKAIVLCKNTFDWVFKEGQTFFILSLIIVLPK